MGELCQNCKKEMEQPNLTHCSDECLFDEIQSEIVEMPYTDGIWGKPWV